MPTPVHTDEAPAAFGAYSQGVVAGGFLFTAGLGPQDPATGQIPEGIEAQTHQVMSNLAAVLATRGLDFGDVVKVTVHLADLVTCFPGFDRVYAEHLGDNRPARTTVASGLYQMLVEVDMVAALRD